MQIIGKGGFAREVADYLSYQGSVVPIEHFENEEIKNVNPDSDVVIAIGDGAVREKIVNSFPADQRYSILNFGKHYSKCLIKEGAIICPGSILTNNTYIGRHVVINLNVTVGHDSIIEDYVTVSPGVNISGNVAIGKRCYIGTNAVIREKIGICDDVVIGAGAVVVKNITEPGVYVGNPAKKIK